MDREPKLLKGENGLLDAIENRRRRVRELRSRFAQARECTVPVELRQAADARANRGIGDARCAICVTPCRA